MISFKNFFIEKTRTEELLYHVTSLDNLNSIKKQGLIPNKKLNWNKEWDEYKSFGGTYLSKDLGIISDIIEWNSDEEGYYLLVVMKSTSQMWNDEDDIRTGSSFPFRDLYKINEYLERFLRNENTVLEEIRNNSEQYFNNLIDQFKTTPQKQKILKDIIFDNSVVLFFGMLESYQKLIDPKLLKNFKIKLGISDSVYDQYRRVLDQITKLKLEDKNFGIGTGRINKPIGYSGSPRIVSLISFSMEEDEDGEVYMELIDVEYNKLPDQELDKILDRLGLND